MDGDPQGDRHTGPLDDALSERVANLEREVSALRGEVGSLIAGIHALQAAPHAAPSAVLNANGLAPASGARRIGGSQANRAEAPDPEAPPDAATVAAPRSLPRQSLETRLGTAILSKVAVVLLLLGAAWFLKWAFDNRWIGPAGRVAAGLAAGVAVNLWAERFRKQQLAGFSYALKAVGSGVLYLSLWASAQLYHLAPAAAVFAAMACVTIWNAVIAWKQDSQLLAGYALLGAYLTPLLLRTGSDQEIFLFSYLLVLALALLWWLRSKRWSALLLGGLAATAALFIAWYVEFFQAEKAALAIGFAVALWAVFAIVPLFAIGNLTGTGTLPAAVLAPLADGVFGALTIYSILADSGGRAWEPWWAVGFAVAYLVLARVKREPGITAAVHLGLAVAFFTAAIPLKLTGRSILLSWLVEAVILVALSNLRGNERNARAVLRGLGFAVLLVATGGVLLQPWLFTGAGTGLLNADFLIALNAVAALAIVLALARARADDSVDLHNAALAAVSLLLLNVVLLVAMRREVDLWALANESATAGGATFQVDFAFSAWMMAQGALMLAAGFMRRVALARWTGLVLLAATLIKMFAVDMRHLGAGYRVVSYLGLGMLLMAVSFAYQKDWLGLLTPDTDDETRPSTSEGKSSEAQV